MTKWYCGFPAECRGLLDLLRLDALPAARELLRVSALLHEARDLVREEARAKSLAVVVVGVDDEVFVNRAQVVHVLAALLRDAIRAVPQGGRVAVTGQELERELVFAVYDSGAPCVPSSRFDYFAAEAAHALGGRVWTVRRSESTLSLFSVPLYRDEN
jgi:K+-sensing histidine kinase KdpD